MIDTTLKIASFCADIFTTAAAAIAVYLFLFKRKNIASAFKILLNYSSQITLSELRTKIERLNDLNTSDPEDKLEIVNIFNEIVGQMRGNKKLKKDCSEILRKLSRHAESPEQLSEPKKRSIVSELRESLRNITVESYDELIGG